MVFYSPDKHYLTITDEQKLRLANHTIYHTNNNII